MENGEGEKADFISREQSYELKLGHHRGQRERKGKVVEEAA